MINSKDIVILRNTKKITQQEMASSLGIAVSTYNMYENGQRKIPRKTASHIANILGVTVNDIFSPATFTLSKKK